MSRPKLLILWSQNITNTYGFSIVLYHHIEDSPSFLLGHRFFQLEAVHFGAVTPHLRRATHQLQALQAVLVPGGPVGIQGYPYESKEGIWESPLQLREFHLEHPVNLFPSPGANIRMGKEQNSAGCRIFVVLHVGIHQVVQCPQHSEKADLATEQLSRTRVYIHVSIFIQSCIHACMYACVYVCTYSFNFMYNNDRHV
jgi:hypothetical protein